MKLRHLRSDAYTIMPPDHPDIDVDAGETFDVDDPVLARSLLEQDANYAPADDEADAVFNELAIEREQHDMVTAAEDVADITAADLRASLETMTPDELRDVRAQEVAGKARKTVLARVDELLAAAGEEA